MTRTISRSLALLGLGLTLTACAQHKPAQANCFNFRDTPRADGSRHDDDLDHGGGGHAPRQSLRFRDAGGGRLI